jgi:hypothetical protein
MRHPEKDGDEDCSSRFFEQSLKPITKFERNVIDVIRCVKERKKRG